MGFGSEYKEVINMTKTRFDLFGLNEVTKREIERRLIITSKLEEKFEIVDTDGEVNVDISRLTNLSYLWVQSTNATLILEDGVGINTIPVKGLCVLDLKKDWGLIGLRFSTISNVPIEVDLLLIGE